MVGPIKRHAATESPGQRLRRAGPGSLSDAELLAMLLGNGTQVMSALELADELLQRRGGITGMLGSGACELDPIPGLGPARQARLTAAVELGRRYLTEPIRKGAKLSAPGEAARVLRAELADLPHEVFACLYLDTRHRLICLETLFRGTIDGAAVHPREVVKRALHHNAAALIAGHNHPSGIAEPSESDRGITLKLAKALELVEIRLLDHVVVSRDGHVSLAERGWI